MILNFKFKNRTRRHYPLAPVAGAWPEAEAARPEAREGGCYFKYI